MTEEIALRVDVPFKDLDRFYKQLTESKMYKSLNVTKYLYTKELAKKTNKEHIHAYIKADKQFSTSSISNFMKKQAWYSPGCYSSIPVKNTSKYKDYCIKDLNIYSTNMDELELDNLIQKAEDIAQDKKLDKKNKLYNYVADNIKPFIDKGASDHLLKEEIIKLIVEWHLDTDTLFPNMSQMEQYTFYIKARLSSNDKKDVINAYLHYINRNQKSIL